MLQFKAYLERKPTDFKYPICQIEKVIVLPAQEFNDLVARPYVDRDFIRENRELMGQRDGAYRCLLTLSSSGNDGILIESEGAGYVRYGAFIPHARDYVENELDRIAGIILKNRTPDPKTGELSIFLDDIAEHTGAEVREDSEIARMFCRILRDHPGVAVVNMIGDCMAVTPSSGQTQGAAGAVKLRDLLLLGNIENAYMVHDTVDVGFVFTGPLTILNDKGREAYADLLNAAVKEIHPGAYGPEIVLTGIDSELLVQFDRLADDHVQAESMMGPTY